MQKKLRLQERCIAILNGETYELSYKELMEAKFEAEYAKMTPQMREFVEYAELLSKAYGWL
jgi:hypothetical protein